MIFWLRDAIERVQNEEDKLFLQSMMGDWTATLGPVDNVLATTEKKVLRRRHREEEQSKKLMQPRACHRARWMAKIIFTCKVAFLSDSDKKKKTKILCGGSFQKLNISCSSLCTCIFPGDDLDLINKLIKYREVDHAMAKKVMHKLKNHLWMVSCRRNGSTESLQLHSFGKCERLDCEDDALLPRDRCSSQA